jgi:CBS domain-containing protein
MPYSVEHLLANQGNVIVIRKTDTITMALDLMIEYDFSQLPVVDENGQLQGMVTYESIMRAARSFDTKLDDLSVTDALVSVPCHYREDDMFDLLDELKITNAVVIVEPEKYVVGIVTSYDASRFLRNRTEDLMHVEDIEFIIKELIRGIYPGEQKKPGSRKPKPFEELNLGDYINLLMSKNIWKFCAPILNVEKESIYELLVRVRQTRNDLAHFRSEISSRSREELRYCANWLRSRYQEYEKEQAGGFINALLEQREQEGITHVAPAEPVAYGVDGENARKIQEGRVTRRSRYAALANWLAMQDTEQVLLTFGQIEEMIDSPLPNSALQLRAWWANDRVGHAHSALWLDAGWKVIYVDLGEGQVIFARIKPDDDSSGRST